MSDPIADIIYKALYNETSPRPMLAESTAKQIRQQIGREWENKVNELLDDRHGSFLTTEDLILTLRKVCQLEES